MDSNTKEELYDALKIITSTISNCEKMQNKFLEGTSQHSLLRNRIKALYISKSLISNEDYKDRFTQSDLESALAPITSIINKTSKAQSKYEEGSTQYKRFEPLIKAMKLSKKFIENEIV